MLSIIMEKRFLIFSAFATFSGLALVYNLYAYTKNKPTQKKLKLSIQQTQNRQHVSQNLNDSKCHSQLHRYEIEKATSIFSEYYFDKNLQMRKILDYLDNEGITVESIYNYSPIVSADQYKKFTHQIRHRRRLIRTINQDQYINIVLNYELQVEELLQRSRQQVVYECQIDPDQFESMKVVYQATQDLSLLMRNAKVHLKQIGFQAKRIISKNSIQKIINQEISFIKSKIYDRLRTKLQNEFDLSQDEILKVVQALIDDIIYEKYGYEREQIQHSLSTRWNTQFLKDIKELKHARSQLQSDIGNFSVMSQQSDQESQNEKRPISQSKTRSGGNSLIIDQIQFN